MTPGPGAKLADATRSFVRGVAVADTAALRRWLAAQRRQVRLPVRLTLDAYGGLAALAGEVAGLSLALDDSRLGVGLADRVRGHGAGGEVRVWLEGDWLDRGATLRISRVGAIIDPAAVAAVAAAAFAEAAA